MKISHMGCCSSPQSSSSSSSSSESVELDESRAVVAGFVDFRPPLAGLGVPDALIRAGPRRSAAAAAAPAPIPAPPAVLPDPPPPPPAPMPPPCLSRSGRDFV